MVDETLAGKTRNRYKYASFYTKSNPIVGYMTALLQPEKNDRILEPCAGEGSFIDSLLLSKPAKSLHVDAVDLNPKAITELQAKYNSNKGVRIIEADTLVDSIIQPSEPLYDKVLGNPPYGAWQSQEKRALLKQLYGGYVKETYTLFIKKCLGLLKDGGRLVFIVPDTFLTLNMQKSFRKFLLEGNTIESVTVFPSKFFPGVNFGYSKLCIISIKKGYAPDNTIRFTRLSQDVNDLLRLIDESDTSTFIDEGVLLNQDEVLHDEHLSILPKKQTTNSITKPLGELAKCVTGFYSGDNERFLKVKSIRNAKEEKHGKVTSDLIYLGESDRASLIEGVDGNAVYIPILKGGRHNFQNDTNWLVNWSKDSVQHYHVDKKARFQNSDYYFTQGIGVPMVRSKSSTSAFLLNYRIFDQSVVGIFPYDKNDLLFLLGLLNSKVYLSLMAEINHTTNNSANYVKRIPVAVDSSLKPSVEKNIQQYLDGKKTLEETMLENDKFFLEIYHQAA